MQHAKITSAYNADAREDTAPATCTTDAEIIVFPRGRENGPDVLTAADRARIVARWQEAAGWVRQMRERVERVERVTAPPRWAAAVEQAAEQEARDAGDAA